MSRRCGEACRQQLVVRCIHTSIHTESAQPHAFARGAADCGCTPRQKHRTELDARNERGCTATAGVRAFNIASTLSTMAARSLERTMSVAGEFVATQTSGSLQRRYIPIWPRSPCRLFNVCDGLLHTVSAERTCMCMLCDWTSMAGRCVYVRAATRGAGATRTLLCHGTLAVGM